MATPFLGFSAVLIFVLWYILFRRRSKRRKPLTNEERFLDWGSFIAALFAVAYPIAHDSGFRPPELEPYSLAIMIIFAAVAIGLLAIRQYSKKRTIGNPTFNQLTIHYSHKDDTPDTKTPSRPRYVSFKTEAYWINDEIELHIRQHEISHWFTYDGEQRLCKSLSKQGIHINDKNPEPEELGLWRTPDGSLMLAEKPYGADIMLKLQERKRKGELKNYELVLLSPWSNFLRKWAYRDFPFDKRLIVNHSNNTAYLPPIGHMNLWHDGIICCQPYRRWVPYEFVGLWCWRNHFKRSRQQCDISELTGDDQKQQ